jgi:hypothetical protein
VPVETKPRAAEGNRFWHHGYAVMRGEAKYLRELGAFFGVVCVVGITPCLDSASPRPVSSSHSIPHGYSNFLIPTPTNSATV